ncbi:SPX-domain-containing protein [Hortaea werneckii]|nr:SPX-domain-containing protein [Hortaea werneckii]KAI7001077.1 SPX-domain-containing protein [Hortaea werneckii]KAI7147202.1 SPX-domain-containing protein [Hortaea werneckii]KAI7175717.1 SPX-domain-containing protein [Hortaea werneckii]
MRFGRTLQVSTYAPWRDNYIDYTKLKKLLRDDESAPNSPTHEAPEQWTDEDEGKFVDELVNVQLEKVHAFHKDIYEKLRERTAKCESRLDSVAVTDRGATETRDQAKSDSAGDANGGGDGLIKPAKEANETNGNGKKAMSSEEEKQSTLKEVLTELDQITKETNELEKYSRINYTGFLKAAKKHDRKRGASYRVRPLLQVRLAALPFNKEDYSPLLYRLSAMYSFVRQHLDGADKNRISMSESQQGREEYTSRKFWVHPDNLLELKTMILRRLPVLVYNPQTSKVAEGSQPDPSITSIYFDNPAFNLYTRKVDQGEASSLRLRWYGQLNARPEIYVEKKTVKEDDTSDDTRLTTKEKYVQRFIKSEYGMEKQIQKLSDRNGPDSDKVNHLKTSTEEIQNFIKENDLQPMLRANYTRTAFQIPGDDRVRISLDTNVAFIREDAIDDRPCRDPESWHRTDIDNSEMEYPFSSIRKGEIVRFPFALLEVRLRNSGSRKNEWVEDIIHSHLVKEAPRFSKFVHGVAQLFEDYVNTFPFWLSEMETDIRKDPQKAFEDEQAKKQKELDDEFAVGSFLKSKTSPNLSRSQHKSQQKGIISPVGSPSVQVGSYMKSANEQRGGKKNDYGTLTSQNAPVDGTVEELDDDETGEHTHHTERSSTFAGGLKNLFPGFSASKYATAKRSKQALPPGVSKPEIWIKDQGPVKVEAKVWLANQRTFIKWQHVSVLLASLSLGLFNAAGQDNNVARALAIVYTIVALLTAGWGYGIYMWRMSLIERRSGKDFDAVTGPVVVCVGLIVALVLNFAFKYQAIVNGKNPGEQQPPIGGVPGGGNATEYLASHFGELKT